MNKSHILPAGVVVIGLLTSTGRHVLAQETGASDTTATSAAVAMNCPMMAGGMGMQHGQGQGMQHGQGQGMQHGQGQGMQHGMGMKNGMAMGAATDSCPMMSMPGDSAKAPPLSDETIGAIHEALQDEFRTEAMYQSVISQHGQVRPFSNIVNAEQRHAGHLIALLTAHEAPVPESTSTPADFPKTQSVVEACAVAATAEVDNVAIYDRLLELDLPDDVRSTFDHLRMISQEHHLPAFRRCAGTN